MNDLDLMKQIENFVDLQKFLTNAFCLMFPSVKDLKTMLDAPWCGCLDTERGFWLFKKHGSGLAFKNWDGVMVDVHEEFGSPELIDACRASQYLESIIKQAVDEGVRYEFSVDEFEYQTIETRLSRLASSGLLTQLSGNRYKLASQEAKLDCWP